MHRNLHELVSSLFVVVDGSRHLCPKCSAVVHVLEVTELMNNDVVLKTLGKEKNTVVEIEVLLCGATPPARTLIANSDTVVREIVEGVPVGETLVDFLSSLFAVGEVVVRGGTGTAAAKPPPYHPLPR